MSFETLSPARARPKTASYPHVSKTTVFETMLLVSVLLGDSSTKADPLLLLAILQWQMDLPV
jgi:hypothetical protein